MKKFLYVSNFILIGVIFFQACNSSNSQTVSNLSFQQGFDSCQKLMCKSYPDNPPAGVISDGLLTDLLKLYQKDKGKSYITRTHGEINPVEDARSIWFPLDKIKHYIWYIEHHVCEAGCYDKMKLGLRFYYIKYPDNLKGPDVPLEIRSLPASYAGHHSLVMVPGYIYKNKLIDFDPASLTQGCNPRRLHLHNQVTDTVRIGLTLRETGIDINGENHGGIEPPDAPLP